MMPRKILTKNPGPSSVKLFPSSAKQKLKIKIWDFELKFRMEYFPEVTNSQFNNFKW